MYLPFGGHILKEQRNATDKNIILKCLNDGLVKSLLKIFYWVFIALLKYQNVILTLNLRYKMKTYENVKSDVNIRIKIKKPRLFHVWLFGIDLTLCKLNKRPIIFLMQSNIASKHAT